MISFSRTLYITKLPLQTSQGEVDVSMTEQNVSGGEDQRIRSPTAASAPVKQEVDLSEPVRSPESRKRSPLELIMALFPEHAAENIQVYVITVCSSVE